MVDNLMEGHIRLVDLIEELQRCRKGIGNHEDLYNTPGLVKSGVTSMSLKREGERALISWQASDTARCQVILLVSRCLANSFGPGKLSSSQPNLLPPDPSQGLTEFLSRSYVGA